MTNIRYEDAKWHWLHLFDFSPMCILNFFSIGLLLKNQSHIVCICLVFLHCEFSNAALTHLHKRKQNWIGSICLTFLHGASSNESSNCLPGKMKNYTCCTCVFFLHCVFFWNTLEFSYESSNGAIEKMYDCIVIFHGCALLDVVNKRLPSTESEQYVVQL